MLGYFLVSRRYNQWDSRSLKFSKLLCYCSNIALHGIQLNVKTMLSSCTFHSFVYIWLVYIWYINFIIRIIQINYNALYMVYMKFPILQWLFWQTWHLNLTSMGYIMYLTFHNIWWIKGSDKTTDICKQGRD